MSVKTLESSEKESSAAPRSHWRNYAWSLTALSAAVVVSILWHNERTRSSDFFGHSIGQAKEAYDFRLINQQGMETRLSQWRGQVVLFCFGFTHCPSVCPTTLTNLVAVYRALPVADRDRVRVAFISVDTRRDTPQTLKDYLSYFDPAIIGLTGSKEDIDGTIGGYGASYAFIHTPGDAPENYNLMHSSNVYLVNPKGQWELIYDFQQLQEPAKVAADIDNILHR
jgi:protein SCO1/2